ncbi:MAG: TraR/DksA C4-type zinc finger protein [Desulfobacteraceae bacterium]
MFEMKNSSYATCENDHYLNQCQMEYFREKLHTLREELKQSNRRNLWAIDETETMPIEEMERVSLSFNRDIEIQHKVRNWNLLQKIDQALERINNGTYGYCEATEEPIGIHRLEANPVTTFCFDVQNSFEMLAQQTNRMLY